MTAQSAEMADHVIICGANALASRMAEELTARYGLAVTAIVPSVTARHGALLQAMPGVRVLERAELDDQAFLDADLPSARGLAIVHEDDLGNVHAALRAQDINPRIRLVIAIFNVSLGSRIGSFFRDCEVLSEAYTAAPSLVAAALGEPAPSHVRIAGQTMYVERRDRVGAGRIICGLAASIDAEAPTLLPADDTAAGIVLAVADGTPRNPLSRRRQRRLMAPLRMLRRVFGTQMGLIFAGLLALLVAGFALLVATPAVSGVNALYLTLIDAAGAAVSQVTLPGTEKLAQILLTLVSLAFVPVVTAAFVGSRIAEAAGRDQLPLSDHVIVAGLGALGTRIVGQLHDLGFDVVAIDTNPEATGMALARRLGARIVIGEAHRDEILLAAGVTTCQAVVSVTDGDIVNLEAALNARALAARPRIVVRLYDDDLAAHVQAQVSDTVSRSASYLAAPEFAAAILRHQVLRTIAVGRHVLLLGEVGAAGANGEVEGQPVAALHRPGMLRVIGLRRSGSETVDWAPAGQYVLQPGDRILVLGTRAGLSGLLRPESSIPPSAAPAAS